MKIFSIISFYFILAGLIFLGLSLTSCKPQHCVECTSTTSKVESQCYATPEDAEAYRDVKESQNFTCKNI